MKIALEVKQSLSNIKPVKSFSRETTRRRQILKVILRLIDCLFL